MKRTDALKPLSHEHHQALFIAKRLTEEEGPAVADDFAEFWEKEGKPHFQVEEEVLIPGSGLPGPNDDEQVAKLFEDHRAIRERVSEVLDGGSTFEQRRELGIALADHVRFEERELFPRIEAELNAISLDRLARQIEAAEAGR